MGKVNDDLLDAAVDKLWLIVQRTDARDFIDLYLILNSPKCRIGIWELMEGVKRKFGFELNPVLIASDFLKIEEFDFLPRMLVPLKISDLHAYFKKQAVDLAQTFTK